MAKFVIYTYKLHLTSDSRMISLFPEEETLSPSEALAHKQDIFQQILDYDVKGEKKFECKRKSGKKDSSEWKDFDSQVVWSQNNITFMQIANKKDRLDHKDFKKYKGEDYPWCNIVIDNRYDVQHIAIQNNSAFSNTDVVAAILQDSFNYRLYGYYLETDIDAMYQSRAFWSVIDRYKDVGIKMIQFDFAFPNLPWASKAIEQLNDGAKALGGRPTAKFTASDGGRLFIDSVNRDENVQTMTNACTGTGADILVQPNGNDTPIHCRDDKEQRVQKQVPDDVLDRADDKDLFNSNFDYFRNFADSIQKFYD